MIKLYLEKQVKERKCEREKKSRGHKIYRRSSRRLSSWSFWCGHSHVRVH